MNDFAVSTGSLESVILKLLDKEENSVHTTAVLPLLEESTNKVKKKDDDHITKLLLELMKKTEQEESIDERVKEENTLTVSDSFAYSLTLPSYLNTESSSYVVNYIADAIKSNDSKTQATFEAVPDDKDIYSAALEVAKESVEKRENGKITTEYDRSLETNEKQKLFKLLHPAEWVVMNYNRTTYQLAKMMAG